MELKQKKDLESAAKQREKEALSEVVDTTTKEQKITQGPTPTNGQEMLSYLREVQQSEFSVLLTNISNYTQKFRRVRIFCPMGRGKKLFERLGVHAALVVGKTEIDFTMS